MADMAAQNSAQPIKDAIGFEFKFHATLIMERDTGDSGYQKKPHDALHRANARRMLCDGMPRQDYESQSNQHERDQLPWTFGMLEQ